MELQPPALEKSIEVIERCCISTRGMVTLSLGVQQMEVDIKDVKMSVFDI